MENFQTFWTKWRVFILGLLSTAVLAVNQLMSSTTEEQDIKVYVLAAAMAALAYIAKEWRGKGVTLLGIIGICAATLAQNLEGTTEPNWTQIIFSILAAVLAAAAPPPKADTYEKDANIVAAKSIPPPNPVEDTTPSIPPPNKEY